MVATSVRSCDLRMCECRSKLTCPVLKPSIAAKRDAAVAFSPADTPLRKEGALRFGSVYSCSLAQDIGGCIRFRSAAPA